MGNFANILWPFRSGGTAADVRHFPLRRRPLLFALAPGGDLFPCSEFIGLEQFCGGNLFRDEIPTVLESDPFRLVTGRKVEDIEPCRHCAIRHFCGSPCPAEAHEMNGDMQQVGAFCEFYEEQVRYAFRLIADDKVGDFLWDGWDEDLEPTFAISPCA